MGVTSSQQHEAQGVIWCYLDSLLKNMGETQGLCPPQQEIRQFNQ